MKDSFSLWPPVALFRYYIFREDLNEFPERLNESPVEGITLDMLDASNVGELFVLPERTNPRSVLEERFSRGDVCLGIRKEGVLIGFCWTNIHWVYFATYRMPLKELEAYVYDVYVLPEWRGKGLAGYIRCMLIEELSRRGYRIFFSACLVNNSPAIRFREKLGVRKVDQGFTLKFFNRWRIGTKAHPEKIRSA